MAFTVDDFQDLLRLLEERPEWREQLRRHVLTDELLSLPDVVRELVKRVDDLASRVAELTDRVGELATAQMRTEQHLASLTGRVGLVDGRLFELHYASRAPAYFSRVARRLRVLDAARLADLLDDAVEAGQVTPDERSSAVLADIVMSGRRRDDGAEVYFVVETSIGVGLEDVVRAVERARILSKLGQPAVPAVAGGRINDEAARAAAMQGVLQMIDAGFMPAA